MRWSAFEKCDSKASRADDSPHPDRVPIGGRLVRIAHVSTRYASGSYRPVAEMLMRSTISSIRGL